MKNVQKRRKVAGGAPCPKCQRQMQRYEHAEAWEPKPEQAYFYAYWDRCKACTHMQMYEEAKVELGLSPEERESGLIITGTPFSKPRDVRLWTMSKDARVLYVTLLRQFVSQMGKRGAERRATVKALHELVMLGGVKIVQEQNGGFSLQLPTDLEIHRVQ